MANFGAMYVRKKKNKSGVISVQVIDKSTGSYKVVHTVGSSNDNTEVQRLLIEGKKWILNRAKVVELDFTDYKRQAEQVLEGIEQLRLCGGDLVLGKIFDAIGFDKIRDTLFRQLVICRLLYPVSKLKTTDWISKYQSLDIDVERVYRYLDKLYNTQKEMVQQISYEHTLKILNGHIQIVFYDVTTVYFEAESEDELRKTGFSKDGKHRNPQIVLGLLVGIGGYPLAYDIFEGNKFEGHTMLPVIEHFKNKYKVEKLIVVADAGLLSKENIELLQQKGYEYILGAKIKTENEAVKGKILSLSLKNGQTAFIQKYGNTKLIISYSESRARKDGHNRQRGLDKLHKQIKAGKLTKSHINNRGYNKFLEMQGDVHIAINDQKIESDKRWDGLKGYVTNTTLSNDEVIDNYKQLWHIEKAFRIAKTDLKIRPIYHRLQRRIEAHICIAFVAYKVYKELERQLKEKQSALSVEKVIDIAKTIFTLKVVHPISKETIYKTLIITDEQRILANLFKF